MTSPTKRNFESLEALVAALEGKRVIRRVLIANNGLAALKGIRSMRQWAYEMLGDESAIQFVCMATPEDIRVNVEYIKMADETVEVPGGRNSNNYANVQLIIDIAVRTNCDAVWAGWGHASENPALPDGLKEKKIQFLGPGGSAMHALGDKIASTIIAQSAGVPTIAWSGSGLSCPSGDVPPELYQRACIRDAQHCLEVCRQLQFPLMIKASEGGGGKGIRMVHKEEEVENAYHAVAGEVVRSPIFVMRLAHDVRHLEVQLLADEAGQCIAVRTRDCSVQRRHQKIIEEGPVVRTIPGVLENMEKAAVRLAEMVGYRGVGTVEYLYHKETGAFYFLELNPRLQVEHTVSELITGVNLPACMLCVGMGIPLHRIPDVRTFYSKARFDSTPINFATEAPFEPKLHTIACRITAENPDDGFTPTTGTIDEINFRNSKNAWGYFSVSSHGGIHEFADSQFGHIFSTAETRDEAIAGMVLALKQLTIRGEIRTTKEYLIKLLDMPAFKASDVSTAWLDGLIKNRLRVEAPNCFLSVLCAATFKAVERFDTNRAKYLSFLEAGHVPSSDLLSTKMNVTLVLDHVKYDVTCTKVSPSEWVLTLCGSHTQVGYRRLADRGLLISLDGGRSPVVYAEEDASCLRVNIDGRTATFTHELDPTKLRSQMPGKLVRYLVRDGDYCPANTAFCEIEVMKMYLQLKTSVAGHISLKGQPGTTVHAGKVLAAIEPDDPDSIVRAEENTKGWPPVSQMYSGGTTPPISPRTLAPSTQERAKSACEMCYNLIMGYDYPKEAFELNVQRLASDLMAVSEPDVTLDGLPLPWLTKGLDHRELTAMDGPTAGDARLVHTIQRLTEAFLDVETLYEGGKLHQEVVDGLRASRSDQGQLEEVFDIQLAHAGPLRHRVLVLLLKASEKVGEHLKGLLQRIAALNTPKTSMVVFQARHLLRKIDMPSPASRRLQLQEALRKATKSPGALGKLAEQLQYGMDVITGFLMDDDNELLPAAAELMLRRAYAGAFDLTQLKCQRTNDDRGQWLCEWMVNTKASHNPLKHDGIRGSTSYDDLDSEGTPKTVPRQATGDADPHQAKGLLAIFNSIDELRERFLHVVIRRAAVYGTDSLCEIIIREKKHEHGVLGKTFAQLITENLSGLQSTDIYRITFIVIGTGNPLYYTFRKSLGFKEDTTLRHIAPTLAYMLELPKLRNYDIQLYQGNPVSQVHVYYAKEKEGLRPRPVATKPRLFVRTLVVPGDVTAPSNDSGLSSLTMYDAETVMANCIHALEIATSDRSLGQTAANHIFLAFEGFVVEFSAIRSVVEKISEVHSRSLFPLGVVETEVKLLCTLSGSDTPVLVRFFVSNPTTHAIHIDHYIEIEDAQEPGNSVLMHLTEDGRRTDVDDSNLSSHDLLNSINVGSVLEAPTPTARGGDDTGSTDGSLKSPLNRLRVRTSVTGEATEHGSKKSYYWHHQPPLAPYPPLSILMLRRLTAIQNNTLYVYDWVELFDKALRVQWEKAIAGRPDLPKLAEAMPLHVLTAHELIYQNESLSETLRPAGENKIGMVGWKWTLYHPSQYDPAANKVIPRDIYVVANDITVMSGSFSTGEDELFAAVCRAARKEGVPLVYISSNSGARIGLDPELKKLFKIQPSTDPSQLFSYLYIDNETKAMLEKKKRKVALTEPVYDENGTEVHHRITAIIGEQWGLGVENLSGSGLIAGEMALCYDSIPTISVASGRSVGIGAYLVRLGRRVVQTKGTPIILTGNNALNKLLGKEVYTSNSQLGGPNIMGPNGVSHWISQDDYKAVLEVMKWLNYVPNAVPVGNAPTPPTLSRIPLQMDPVDRDVEVTTAPNRPYDVRNLIEGVSAADGGWVPGLFDRGSFHEAQEQWAKTVVVGRAKLGGIPVGVVGVETRAINKFNPADPADPTSVSTMTAQAGMVWYPDSARKTADFIADLHREHLPAIILANWRGFSGGMRDMFDEVLKFGADIVQNLTHYRLPVIVYIPQNGELRGGAWVVIDPTINKRCIEMFVDDTARGGVLEPSGIIEIKYREKEIYDTMDRLDPECHRLSTQLKSAEGQLQKYLENMLRVRHEALFPMYKAVATEFADLHDRPGRMLAVKSINGVVSWKNSRRFLYWRLRRRLQEFHARDLMHNEGISTAEDQTGIINEMWRMHGDAEKTWEEASDEEQSLCLEKSLSNGFVSILQEAKQAKALSEMQKMLKTYPDLLKKLVPAVSDEDES